MAFTDVLGQYMDNRLNSLQNRFDTAGQYLTDPGAAFENRLLTGNTLDDEEERRRRERERLLREQEQQLQLQQAQQLQAQQAAQAQQAQTAEQPAPGAPATVATEMAPQAVAQPVAPDQSAAETQRLAQQAAEAAQRAEAAVKQAPAAPAVPQQQLAPTPGAEGQALRAMAPQPAPMPSVQVAGATQMPAAAAPAVPPQTQVGPSVVPTPPVVAPAPPVKANWQQDLGQIYQDQNELAKYMANPNNTPEGRKAAANLLKIHLSDQDESAKAEKLVMGMMQGDTKSTNQVLRDLKKGQEEGSYVKAYLFARLGLNDLAREEQSKLSKATKWGQLQMDGQNYSVTTNAQGAVTAAYDESGAPVNDRTLSKLMSSGLKTGTQAYSQTGEIHNTPDGKQVVKVFSSQTGKPMWVDIESGEQWKNTGKGNPVPQSISTQMAKMDYGVISDYRKKFGTDKLAAMDQARKDGVIKSPADEAAFLERWNFTQGVPGYGGPGAPVQQAPAQAAPAQAGPVQQAPAQAAPAQAAGPVAPQRPAAAVPAAAAPIRPGSPAVTGVMPVQGSTAPGAGGAGAPPQRGATEPETVYKNRLADWEKRRNVELDVEKARREEEQRKIGAAAGEAQAGDVTKAAQAREVYGIAQSINTALQKATGSGIGAKVDDIAAFFGKSTEGAKATADLKVLGDRILKSVPRFQGPQSDRDVASYHAAAGQLADPTVPVETRAAAFKTIIELNKKYYPDLDWSFGGSPSSGTTGSGVKWKVVK